MSSSNRPIGAPPFGCTPDKLAPIFALMIARSVKVSPRATGIDGLPAAKGSARPMFISPQSYEIGAPKLYAPLLSADLPSTLSGSNNENLAIELKVEINPSESREPVAV